jgi:pilus assembly protein CpaC
MMPSKDGIIGAASGRFKGRLLRPGRRAARMALLTALAAGLLPCWTSSHARGETGPLSPGRCPTAGVLANRTSGALGQAVAMVEHSAASANRPGALALRSSEPRGVRETPARIDDQSGETGGRGEAVQAGPPESPLLLMDVVRIDPPAKRELLAFAGNNRQEPEQPAVSQPDMGSIVAAVRTGGTEARPIAIAKNCIAVIDLKVAVDRAEIADPKVAEIAVRSPRRIELAGREIGNTQLVLWIGDQQQVFDVSVELNLTNLQNLIKARAPSADVQVGSINGKIVLSGYVPDAETAERLADLATLLQGGEIKNQLMVAGVQQTMLRVVVAEVNKTALRELGVNWAIGGSDWTRDFFFSNNLGQLNPTVFSSSGVGNLVAKNSLGGQMTYSVAGVGNGAASNVTFGFPRAELQMFMQALRENDLSKTLAEPNLVAISGQTASFLAGGEVPIPITQGGATAGSITIEYKEFGVRLAFTPTVLGGQVIRLHVMTEVSEAVPGAALAGGLPTYTFNTRRVETTIECGNGESFAIAGLLNDQVRAVASKIPGLGDIPVLGALLSSTRYQKSESELVVLVTPQLVEPLEPHQVGPPPGSLMSDPNDFELFAMQQLEGRRMPAPEGDRIPRHHSPVNTRPGEATGWPTSQLALRGPWGIADFDGN